MARLIGGWSLTRAVVMILVILATLVVSYPSASQWLSQRAHQSVIAGYVSYVRASPSARLKTLLAVARKYNADLPNGPLRDPYAVDPQGRPVPVGEGKAAYERTLDTDGHGLMGQIVIPKIDLALPIYHDTSGGALDKGVGHLYGSGLPVGGPGTHAVLAAHSGVATDSLFTGIDRLAKGDTFSIGVLDQVLTYRVSDIRTVLPTDLTSLRQVPGQDLVTLVTCTPVGVNTHRLLVTGTRVRQSAAGEQAARQEMVAGPGYPWWLVAALAVLLLALGLSRPLGRRALLPGRSDGRAVLAVTERRRGSKDYQVWQAHCARVLGTSFKPVNAVGDSLWTWSLQDGQGASLCVSVQAFSTQQLAWEDAHRWALAYRGLRVNRVKSSGDSLWWVNGPGQGGDRPVPVLVSVQPVPQAKLRAVASCNLYLLHKADKARRLAQPLSSTPALAPTSFRA